MKWQDELASILKNTSLSEILEAIDFDQLTAATPFPDLGVATTRVILPSANGVANTAFAKLFAVGKGRSVIPHGHLGMASGHLVLHGNFLLRQYDRIALESDHWQIKQTIEHREGVGGVSTVSDQRDNIHWLIAEEDSYTLDFIMAPAHVKEHWTIQNLDVAAAEKLADGVLRVPKIGVKDALAKYGRV